MSLYYVEGNNVFKTDYIHESENLLIIGYFSGFNTLFSYYIFSPESVSVTLVIS